MKARVTDNCAGSGVCAETCPEVFEIGPDGTAQVKVDEVPAAAEQTCRQAAADCPLNAIELDE